MKKARDAETVDSGSEEAAQSLLPTIPSASSRHRLPV